MIINCINCNKKFNVNDELIPVNGRQIACGSCNHSWYFQVDKNTEKTSLTQSVSVAQDEITSENNEKNFEISSEDKNSKFICNMHPHNYHLEIITETGLVGLITLLIFFSL